MQRLYALLFLLLPALAFAQKATTIKGRVTDTLTKKGLSYATVSLVHAKDSTLMAFTRADSNGVFLLKGVDKGSYLLSASYVGFLPVWQPVQVNNTTTPIELGDVAMTDVNNTSVTVVAKRPPVVMNGDTLEFNTENFKTQPNAVVEDLLKKLPGVTVDADGTVRVNGQRVNRVYVNGREFFTGDPKMATKNLDADAVDKVQVYDKKSDRADFTGIDDGSGSPAINLKLKKDRDHATFGKLNGGAGNNRRYDAQTNINRFNGNEQLSLIGMANNINKQGFSMGDVLNFTGELARGMRNGGGISVKVSSGDDGIGLPVTGMGPNQQGIATTYAGGLNYNNLWNNKTDLNSNALFSDVRLVNDRNTQRQYLLPGNNYNYTSTGSTVKEASQQRFNLTLDQKIDSFTSFKLTPSLTWQQQKNQSNTRYVSESLDNVKLNDGYNNTFTKATGYNLRNDMILRHKFRKKGRTLSFSGELAYNNSQQDGTLETRNNFYQPGGNPFNNLNQTNSTDANTTNYGGNVTYTEPAGKKALIEINAFYNSTKGSSDKKTFDYNSADNKYTPNIYLTNAFENTYRYGGGGLGYRANYSKFNYGAGAAWQQARLISTNTTAGNTIKQTFTDVLPYASFQYKIHSTSNVRLSYSTSTQQPSTQQLQPLLNVSDPLNIVTGNPDLKRSYSHNISLNYLAADMATRKNFFAFIAASVTQSAIVYADSISATGARKSMPVNANGNMFLFGNASYGFAVRKLQSRFDVSLGANYNKNMAFINGAANRMQNLSINPGISWSYAIDNVIDVRTSATLRISKATYSLQPQLNTNYLTQEYGTEMTNYLPWGLVLNNNFTYTVNTGRADGFNTKIPFYNASVAKGFLKNKRAEIKLTVFDVLGKNVGINRSTSQSYIEDTRYTVLQRYFLCSFTFNLHKSGSAARGPQVQVKTFGN
jgi:hypothetical protein